MKTMNNNSELKYAQSLLDEAYKILMDITKSDHPILYKIDDIQNDIDEL
tara:strand:+ start:2678 stop:2824 length:147 start_codon:yes stop_codon:yes gene_type:complete